MNRDIYDLPLTTSSDRAAAHCRDGVDCMLSAWRGAEDAFDKAIAEDPGFALAHIGRARLHQLNMESRQARAMAPQARELAAGATAREKGHVEIIASVIESKPKLAVSGAEANLEEYIRDAQVLSMLLGAFGRGLVARSARGDGSTPLRAIDRLFSLSRKGHAGGARDVNSSGASDVFQPSRLLRSVDCQSGATLRDRCCPH
jgi:hypothetical protein